MYAVVGQNCVRGLHTPRAGKVTNRVLGSSCKVRPGAVRVSQKDLLKSRTIFNGFRPNNDGLTLKRSPVKTRASSSGTESTSAAPSLMDQPLVTVRDESGEPGVQLDSITAKSGVYAFYNANEEVQYVGISRKISASVQVHMAELPDLTHAVRVVEVESAGREQLMGVWKQWVQEAVQAAGGIPPGNAPGVKIWTTRAKKAVKPEIKLTGGKGIEDLSVPLEEIIDAVVQENKWVVFIKGTRTAPECGFSHAMLTMLNANRIDYEVVNCLDEVFNPTLREVIKTYSDWPTIPQLYHKGEFLGGADIIKEMDDSGELGTLAKSA